MSMPWLTAALGSALALTGCLGSPPPKTCADFPSGTPGCEDYCEDHGATQPCGRTGPGPCTPGVRICTEHTWSACVGAVGPEAERCNGIDDDCDRQVDEEISRVGERCSAGAGACYREGVMTCTAAAGQGRDVPLSCDAQEGPRVAERCNGIDDDCDGETDEDRSIAQPLCPVPGGTGACGAGGCTITSCVPPRYDLDRRVDNGCEYTCPDVLPRFERCDGVDNDCDGRIDEGVPEVGAPCRPGIGACMREGTLECLSLGDDAVLVCNARPGAPREEICDGIDNNCDGTIDDGFADGPDGGCEGLDDDCDGAVDEDAGVCPETRCAGSTSAPPCNGCPAGTRVPRGFVCIPAGEFTMGSPPDEVGHVDHEGPQRRVRISRPLLMMATEVTQAAWRAVLEDIGVDPSYFGPGEGDPCDERDGASCPVERVSWFDAMVYATLLSTAQGLVPCYDDDEVNACEGYPGAGCARGVVTCDRDDGGFDCPGRLQPLARCTGYRLPTEAEWEYAARAGTATPYPLEDVARLDRYAWYRDGSDGRTHPVGQRMPNRWGLYDMHGNVLEWVQDPYAAYPRTDQIDVDPIADGPADERVARGGAYSSPPSACRSAHRVSFDPSRRFAGLGFRVVRLVPE